MSKNLKPIKILLFSSLFPHRGEPTLGIFVANRLKQLVTHENVEVSVVAPVPWFPFKGKIWGRYGRAAMAGKLESLDGIKIYHPRFLAPPKIGMYLNPYFMFFSAKRLIKKLLGQGIQFDIIDAHYLYPDGVVASWLSKQFDKPFVMTARGSDVTEIANFPGPRTRIVRAADEAAHLITVSNNLRQDLIKMGVGAHKITTLRNGVDLDRFRETARVETRQKYGNGKIMLFAGWFIPRKRLDIVLEVAKVLNDITVLLVGAGPMEGALRKEVAAHGMLDRVVFCGQVSPEEMPVYFSVADVLLLPSDREGWANVLLEALACGTPVVTRKVGSAPDLITSSVAGRVVDSDDVGKIAQVVAGVLAENTDRSLVRAFAENYDWRETSAGQMKIFTNILNTSGQQT